MASILSAEEYVKYLKKKKKQESNKAVLPPTNNTSSKNKTLSELNENLDKARNNVQDYLRSNGVILNKESQNIMPNPFTIKENMRKSGDRLIQTTELMRKSKVNPTTFSPSIIDKMENDNVVKFQDYIARDEGKKRVAEFKTAQNERNRRRSELEAQQAE